MTGSTLVEERPQAPEDPAGPERTGSPDPEGTLPAQRSKAADAEPAEPERPVRAAERVPGPSTAADATGSGGPADRPASSAMSRRQAEAAEGDIDMGIMDSIKKLAGKHPEQTGKGMDKAADTADRKTGGKYSDQIKSGTQKAKESFGGEEKKSEHGDGGRSGGEGGDRS